MTTIGDVKEIFAKKGLHFEYLPSENFLVKSMRVVERYVTPYGDSKVVLNIRYINQEGKEISDLFFCEGKIKRKKISLPQMEVPKLLKLEPLPLREKFEFDSESEAVEYVKGAIGHLLRDNGYNDVEREESDLYFEKLHVLVGVGSVTIIYNGVRGLSAEVFHFNNQAKVYAAYAHYDL